MKIINRTGYKGKKIGALFNLIGRDIGQKAGWHKNVEIHIVYSPPSQTLPNALYLRYGLGGNIAIQITVPHNMVATHRLISPLYFIAFYHLHRNNPAGVPSIEHWDKILKRVGYNLIDYPKLPKPALTKSQLRAKKLAHIETLILKWQTKVKYAQSRLKTLRRKQKYYQKQEGK